MFKCAVDTIEKHNLIEKGDKIIIALSGGADSMALLFFLSQLKDMYGLSIFAVHVNHMIRDAEAERDELFVRDYCEQNSIKYVIYKKDVLKISKELKLSTEEAGRFVRYEAFKEALNYFDAGKIAVAHNKNDQAETFLIRLARGSGAKGLAGIPAKNGIVIRPLINLTREQIEEYCNKNNIPYVTDSTNKSDIYTRNKIRNKLLPWMNDNLNPEIIGAIAGAADILREQSEYIDYVSKRAYEQCAEIVSDNRIEISHSQLKQNHICIRRHIIRHAVEKISGSLKDVGAVHIEQALSLTDKGTGKKISAPYGIIFETQYDKLIIKKGGEKPVPFCYKLIDGKPVYIAEKGFFVSLSINKELNLDNYKILCTKMFKCDKMFFSVCFRTRLEGDKIKLAGGSKKLKDYFIDKKIPISVRDSACLIAEDKNVLSVLDIVDSEQVKSGETKFYIQLWETREAVDGDD